MKNWTTRRLKRASLAEVNLDLKLLLEEINKRLAGVLPQLRARFPIPLGPGLTGGGLGRYPAFFFFSNVVYAVMARN